MGNGSRCRLTPSRRRTPSCPMPRWRLECKIAVANEPAGCVLLWLRMQKWKSWLDDMSDTIPVCIISTARPQIEEDRSREKRHNLVILNLSEGLVLRVVVDVVENIPDPISRPIVINIIFRGRFSGESCAFREVYANAVPAGAQGAHPTDGCR